MCKKLRKTISLCILTLLITQSNSMVYAAEATVKPSAICAIKPASEMKNTQESDSQTDKINQSFTEAKETLKKQVTIKVDKVDFVKLGTYVIPGPLVPYIRSAVLTRVDDKTIQAEIEYTTWYQAVKACKEPKLYEKQISETAKKTLAEAKKVIKELKLEEEQSAYAKEKAIHDYIIGTAKYSEVISGDISHAMHGAEGVILSKDGMCRSYAESMQLYMELLGVESKIIMGRSSKNFDKHMWNQVKLDDGNWYYVDLTWDEVIPEEAGKVNYDFFNIPYRILTVDHELEEWQVPEKAIETTYFLYEDILVYCSDDVVDVAKKQLATGKKEGKIFTGYSTDQETLKPLILKAMEETQNYGKLDIIKTSDKLYTYTIS